MTEGKNRFGFTDDQWDSINEWAVSHECSVDNVGAIGGRVSYIFTPTSLGYCEVAKCACGAEIDVTDYAGW